MGITMSRVIRSILLGIALLVAGCASDIPPEQHANRRAQTRIKIVKQTCTTTIKQEDVCAEKKHCYQIKTCAEAYYRYTVCGDRTLDGGTGYQPNGIPCQSVCSREADALEMANRIIKDPFVIPSREETFCTPR
jgi:hypothetical protein